VSNTPDSNPYESDPVKTDECFRLVFAKLEERDRDLIAQYYSANGESKSSFRAELAGEYGLSIEAMRVRVHLIRSRLTDEWKKCLATLTAPESVSRTAALVPVIESFQRL
jgi:hypothetical protein